MTGRAKIGFGDALGGLGDFAPAAPRAKPPAPPKEAAEEAGFYSREAKPETVEPIPRQQRRHRTGRSAQINIKAKPETITAFYAWADEQGLSIAEAFELAIKKLSGS